MKIKKYYITKQDDAYVYEVILIASNNKVYKNVNHLLNGELIDDIKLLRKDNVWYLHTFDKWETHKYIDTGSMFREVKDITKYLDIILTGGN